jgi:hypothetical protein
VRRVTPWANVRPLIALTAWSVALLTTSLLCIQEINASTGSFPRSFFRCLAEIPTGEPVPWNVIDIWGHFPAGTRVDFSEARSESERDFLVAMVHRFRLAGARVLFEYDEPGNPIKQLEGVVTANKIGQQPLADFYPIYVKSITVLSEVGAAGEHPLYSPNRTEASFEIPVRAARVSGAETQEARDRLWVLTHPKDQRVPMMWQPFNAIENSRSIFPTAAEVLSKIQVEAKLVRSTNEYGSSRTYIEIVPNSKGPHLLSRRAATFLRNPAFRTKEGKPYRIVIDPYFGTDGATIDEVAGEIRLHPGILCSEAQIINALNHETGHVIKAARPWRKAGKVSVFEVIGYKLPGLGQTYYQDVVTGDEMHTFPKGIRTSSRSHEEKGPISSKDQEFFDGARNSGRSISNGFHGVSSGILEALQNPDSTSPQLGQWPTLVQLKEPVSGVQVEVRCYKDGDASWARIYYVGPRSRGGSTIELPLDIGDLSTQQAPQIYELMISRLKELQTVSDKSSASMATP